jgi:hypothetical protein
MDSAVAQLAIDRLTIIPFTVHPVFDPGVSLSDVVDYNTISRASFFFEKVFGAVLPKAIRQECPPHQGLWTHQRKPVQRRNGMGMPSGQQPATSTANASVLVRFLP